MGASLRFKFWRLWRTDWSICRITNTYRFVSVHGNLTIPFTSTLIYQCLTNVFGGSRAPTGGRLVHMQRKHMWVFAAVHTNLVIHRTLIYRCITNVWVSCAPTGGRLVHIQVMNTYMSFYLCIATWQSILLWSMGASLTFGSSHASTCGGWTHMQIKIHTCLYWYIAVWQLIWLRSNGASLTNAGSRAPTAGRLVHMQIRNTYVFLLVHSNFTIHAMLHLLVHR